MKRFLILTCALLMTCMTIYAQDEQSTEYSENDNLVQPEYQINQTGDQFLKISLLVSFPMNFPDFNSLFSKKGQLRIGGVGNLSYQRFLTNNLAVGGEIGFGYNVTIGSHSLNYIPILAVVSFQPSINKFEFPLSIGIGPAIQTYISSHYLGLAIKPTAAAFYRITPSWSLGLETSYLFMPHFNQLYDKDTDNNYGHFFLLGITTRYHF